MGTRKIHEHFIREFHLVSSLRHPNVVKVWGLAQEEETAYFLMEYFPRNLGLMMGESYFADQSSRILRIEKAVHYVLETLQGISRMHRQGIVHQDIKPYNLMLTENDTIKITDFGLSKRRGEKFTSFAEFKIGTPHYAAPEQMASPANADHRADLYSVGIMLYRMLTGILPQRPFPLPSALNPELDKVWDGILLKSIHQNPDARFQDAMSMIRAVQSHYQDFKNQKETACILRVDVSARRVKKPGSGPVMLRSTAERVPAKNATSVFKIDAFHRPREYFENRFEFAKNGVVVDGNANLAWQEAGSASPMPWERAKDYVMELNRQKFGGYDHWRLPTINELLSLLNPPPPGEDFCFQSPLSPQQKWVWSGDTRSKRAAWFLDVEMGFVGSSDILDCYDVKAVSSL